MASTALSAAPRIPARENPFGASATLVTVGQITPELTAEWQDLEQSTDAPNPYFASWFLVPALRHLDPNREARLLLIREATGRLIGLMPIVFQKGYAKLPLRHACIWTHQHCFNGAPLIRRGASAGVYAALFEWIDTRPSGSMFFRLAEMPLDTGRRAELASACDRGQRRFLIQASWERAILSGGNEIDAVLSAAMSGKKRKELRRQERRFDELGASAMTVRTITDRTDAIALAEQFMVLENAGWKGSDRHGFPLAGSGAEAQFFREAMAGGAGAGAVECVSLTLDDKPIAMLFTLVTGTHRSAFKTTYDEAYGAYSPGVRVLIEASRAMLASEAVMFDSCACPRHPVVDGLWAERLPMAQVNIPASGTGDRLLLGTAARIEKLKIGALKRLNREEV